MSKVAEAAAVIKAAHNTLIEFVNAISIYADRWGTVEVHVGSIRDLELIPGDIVIVERTDIKYPTLAQKVFDDVRFFCLMTPEEARGMTELVASA